MAKTPPARKISPITWVAILTTIPATWYYLSGDTPPKKPIKHATTLRTSSKQDEFLPEDYKAKYAVLNEAPKDAFKPLVLRNSGLTGRGLKGTLAMKSNGVPADLTGGEGNWVYSGMAVIDGKPTALIENSGTGEGVFLKAGDKWKKSSVRKVTDDTVVLVGQDGTVHVLKQGEDTSVSAKDKGFAPIRALPPMTGPIGSIQVTPDRNARRGAASDAGQNTGSVSDNTGGSSQGAG